MIHLNNILTHFGLNARTCIAESTNVGLINQSFVITDAATKNKFILQRVNTSIFTNPEIIAANISKAASIIRQKDKSYPVIQLHRTASGAYHHIDEEKDCWRLMDFINDTVNVTEIKNTDQAYQTAFSYGHFTSLLTNANTADFIPAIPDFHNLTLRYEQFLASIEQCDEIRKAAAVSYIDYLLSRTEILKTFNRIVSDNLIPQRIIHADTKISNILFDKNTLQPKAVIDWDTIMPGYFISDLGDMVRSMVSLAGESETDMNRIVFRKEYYDAIISGYKDAIALTENELKLVSYAGKFMTYMQALRFLADYLNHDVYYSISYQEQNLDRAKNQCRLLQVLEENT